ncbi:MAG: hypothetical protein L3J67_02505 [Hyphomicrobiaceae bacterium]|nr:hypothetical protein [Hyphomicrobiaceae bacterium]
MLKSAIEEALLIGFWHDGKEIWPLRGIFKVSVRIKINSGEDRPFAVEIDNLPKKIHVEKPDKTMNALPLGLISLVVLFMVFDTGTALLLGGALVILSAFAYWRGRRQYILAFEKDRVLVSEPGFFRDHNWQASYSEYKGIYQRSRTDRSGSSNSTYQIIELKHFEPEKTLPLYVHKTTGKPLASLAAYAKLFGLPVVKSKN